MGLTVFTSAQGNQLRKNYYLSQGEVKSAFAPGKLFETVQELEDPRSHDIKELYSDSVLKNLSVMFGKPSTKTFEKTKETVFAGITKCFVLDIEWTKLELSPQLCSSPEEHLNSILRNLGFNEPEKLEAFIAPSASCGIENLSKPQTYRWHVWLFFDKAYPQDKVRKVLEKALPSPYVDSAPLRTTQLTAIQEGIYPSDVQRHDFKEKYFAREGRKISLRQLEKVKPLPELTKALKAEEIIREGKDRKNGLKRATRLLGKEPSFDSTHSLKLDLEKLAYEPKDASEPNGESKLDGERNLLLYLYIRAALVLEGTAEHFIEWILEDKSIAGDWTRGQLEAKAKSALKSLSLEESLGSVKAHFNPHKVVSLKEKDLSLMSDISEIPTKGKILLSTGEGTGKTSLMFGKWLKRFEEDWEKENSVSDRVRAPRILYVCFRRAVLKQVSLEYGLDNYEEIGKDDKAGAKMKAKERKEAFCPHSNKLAICNRSLLRLKPSNKYPAPYDVVFIDEIEACLDDIYLNLRLGDGDETPWIERDQQYNLLKRICREAGCVIGADASATGLMSGWFMDLVCQEEREEKTLIENSEDYIADKEITLHKHKEGLIKEITEAYHAGEICSVHTGFGNNETQGMETLKKVLVGLGVPEDSIGLYYPQALDDWEKKQREQNGINAPTYRGNPDLIIAQELEKGIKIFINSPALGVGWSVKTERITRIFGIFPSTIFSAAWIKQLIRRIRKALKIDLFITPQKSEPPSDETEKLLNEILLDDYPKEEYSHFQMRGDLKQLTEKQAIRTSFIKLIEKCGASWEFVDLIGKDERKRIIGMEKNCSFNAVTKHLKEFENVVKIIENFRLLSGEKIKPELIEDEIVFQSALTYHRDRGKELVALLALWDDYERIELIRSKDLQRIFAFKVLVLHEIDLMFQECFQETSFLDWYLNREKEDVGFYWALPKFTEGLDRLIEEHGSNIQRLFFKVEPLKEITPQLLMNEVAQALFLDYKNTPQSVYKEFGTTAKEVRDALKKSYKIPKGEKVGPSKELLLEALDGKERGFTRNEEIFLACNGKYSLLRKKLLIPSKVSFLSNEREGMSIERTIDADKRKNLENIYSLLGSTGKNKEFER